MLVSYDLIPFFDWKVLTSLSYNLSKDSLFFHSVFAKIVANNQEGTS